MFDQRRSVPTLQWAVMSLFNGAQKFGNDNDNIRGHICIFQTLNREVLNGMV